MYCLKLAWSMVNPLSQDLSIPRWQQLLLLLEIRKLVRKGTRQRQQHQLRLQSINCIDPSIIFMYVCVLLKIVFIVLSISCNFSSTRSYALLFINETRSGVSIKLCNHAYGNVILVLQILAKYRAILYYNTHTDFRFRAEFKPLFSVITCFSRGKLITCVGY